jgi:hypothetical protein
MLVQTQSPISQQALSQPGYQTRNGSYRLQLYMLLHHVGDNPGLLEIFHIRRFQH